MSKETEQFSFYSRENYPLLIEDEDTLIQISVQPMYLVALSNVLSHLGDTYEGQVTELEIKLSKALKESLDSALSLAEKDKQEKENV